ncbi:MAG: CotH kinase family protein [Verrucomicrobia bacterium]|nr:CotH kinase family protein [Verrucomicrobiota bacterium]
MTILNPYRSTRTPALAVLVVCAAALHAQSRHNPPAEVNAPPAQHEQDPPAKPPEFDGPPPFGPGGFGPGAPGQSEIKLVRQFDEDRDKRLNNAERKAARARLAQLRGNRGPGGSGGGRGPWGNPGDAQARPLPGVKLSPADVKSYPGVPMYDAQTLRTFFLEYENQRLGGYRTFNLLNAHGDPTFLRSVLYYHIARNYIPVPKANFVRVVINGEN